MLNTQMLPTEKCLRISKSTYLEWEQEFHSAILYKILNKFIAKNFDFTQKWSNGMKAKQFTIAIS